MSKSKPRPAYRYGDRYRDAEERIYLLSSLYLDITSIESLAEDASVTWVDGTGKGYRVITPDEALKMLRDALAGEYLVQGNGAASLYYGGPHDLLEATLFEVGGDRLVLMGVYD